MKTIKQRVDDCYRRIKEAQEELVEIRSQCKHPATEYTKYMWAPGHILDNAKICSVCGELLENGFEDLDFNFEVTTSSE